ncbi:hypothetical protein [Kordiimonas marina]|uniref:hypothetical protein n=1 Tax=Kordiimonas marina TaxID=2872312 RepID=UPI001FF5CA8D|nr:hypothetical protein [Kordiimonas marina]MCJ9428627.1 hypothetical protein [Kordiimonas marina]
MAVALIWATAMLIAAYLMRESGHKDDMFMLILAMGFTSFLVTSRGSRCKRSLFRRLFHKGGK